MSSAAVRKASAGIFSMASLDAARTRATSHELAEKINQELRVATSTRKEPTNTPIAHFTQLLSTQKCQQPRLADLELFLRSKRVYYKLMERYNPLYGMSEQERIKASARTVGLDVPDRKSD
ncbi:hypothetical protein MYAM1_000859 [Malassezia yamatoensis]|uniref:Uncharacterized protein n=1 Tax=Malassezia yamatoensis TaxID=253288 RepID=A0AAJ5YRZ4_9BASI|nr:hypothetical protein MYAM1_000859 [Malassezia yamatoensis]